MPVGGTVTMTLSSRMSHHNLNGVNGNINGGNVNIKDMDRCSCCPYGYHIDRDFVPFTRKMLSREANVERLRELRAKLRSQRKSMDKLLGVPPVAAQSNTWEAHTISRASVDVWKNEFRRERDRERNHQGGDITDTAETADNGDSVLLETSLQAAVKDFEEALNRTRPKNLTFDIADSSKFHTFPRIKAPSSNRDVLSTMKDSRTSIRDLTNQMEGTHVSDNVHNQRLLSSSRKANGIKHEENETSKELIKDDRTDVVAKRIRELEEMIPELQVKVTLLTEEKRQVMKLLEVEKTKRTRIEEIYESLKNSTSNGQIGDSDVNQNVVALAAQRSSTKKLTKDTGVGPSILTRDVGNSPINPSTRSVGVGDTSGSNHVDSSGRSETGSPTRSNGWTMRRKVRTFETGCQVTEHDLGVKPIDPILQIIERVDCSVQTVEKLEEKIPKNSNSRVLKSTSTTMTTSPTVKTVGISAKPRTMEIGVSSKPNSREIGMNTAAESEKPVSKHVGVSVALDKSQSLSSIEEKHEQITAREVSSKPAVTVATNTTLTLSPTCEDEKIIAHDLSTSTLECVSSSSPSNNTNSNKVSGSSSFTVMKHGRDSSSSMPIIGASEQQSTSTTTDVTAKSDSNTIATASISPEQKPPSRIPRLATPSSPSTSPKLTIKSAVVGTTAEPLHDSHSSSRSLSQGGQKLHISTPPFPTKVKPPPLKRQATYTKEYHGDKKKSDQHISESSEEEEYEAASVCASENVLKEQRTKSSPNSSPSPPPIPPHADFSTIVESREKISPSPEMRGALKVLNDALLRGRTTQQVTTAISIILHEWFRVAGTKNANPSDVEDYLDTFESFSPQLLRYITNVPDGNGNTALHYAVSHGNFDVVSILLDSKVCDPNKANKAGYTSVMLVSLAKVLSDTHRQVVRRLFSLGDVNIKAAQHGQTALMLAASHGRLDTVKLLLEAGADINIQDEDGSTALMCASEHGHGEIVKYFLTQSDCDPHITDNDGSTALSVSMEAGHKDIGVMLYAHMHFVVGPNSNTSPNSRTSPNSTRAKKSRSETPGSQSMSPALSSQASPVTAKKQYSTH